MFEFLVYEASIRMKTYIQRCQELHVARLAGVFFLCGLLCVSGYTAAQDAEAVKATLLKNLAKIENYSAGKMKGRWITRSFSEEAGQFEFRGDNRWLEFDYIDLEKPREEQAARHRIQQKIKGTEGKLSVSEFDGKKLYEFDPYNLALTVESVKKMPPIFSRLPLYPAYWLHMGSIKSQLFRRLAEKSDYEVKVEQLTEGRWKFSQTGLGNDFPEERRKRLAVTERYIIVDENFGCLVTEYYGNGFLGKIEGTLEWAQQDGNWYVKHGKQSSAGMPYMEWFIDEISFDASGCRTKFNELESTIPFATRIFTYDESGKEVSQTYKGGKEGEAEHKLRNLAWLKREKEGFK